MNILNTRQCSPYGRDLKEIYYSLASFKFNMYKIPEHFNLTLLADLGWYSCPGKRRKKDSKNINGVSRDHLYSRADGIINKIHPLLLSHPANCRLISHKENKSKQSTCAVSIEELVKDILNFKYIKNVPNHTMIIDIIKNNNIYIDNFEDLRKLI